MATDNDQFHYQFIHNVFGCFIENTLEYFADYLYPRFQHTVVGTYDKAVEYINKQEQYGREGDKPNLPALILNPSGDFNLDDANALGHQMWRFPHLAPNLASALFEPIYMDNNVEISVAFTRLKGEFELLSLVPSFYEYFDLKIFLIQMFGGEGRYIEPMYFNDFIILPPELVNYKYENDATGVSYNLDWTSNSLDFLVETTNQNELVVPGKVKPRYVMRGMSDGSTRYGGTDDMADWKLSTIIEYELEIPSYMVLRTDTIIENTNFNLSYSSTYSTYEEYSIPDVQETIEVHIDSGLQENKNTVINPVIQENPDIEEDLANNETTNTVTETDPADPTTEPEIITETSFDYQESTPEELSEAIIDSVETYPDPPPTPLVPSQDMPPELVLPPKSESEDPLKYLNEPFRDTPSAGGCAIGETITLELQMKTRYFHKVTKAQADSEVDYIITLPEPIYDKTLLKVNSKYGPMEYNSHYVIQNNGTEMRIIVENVNLDENDMIELFVYEVPFNAAEPVYITGKTDYESTTGAGAYNTPQLNVRWALSSTCNCNTEINSDSSI